MSHYAVFNRHTEFRLANGEESVAAIEALIDELMDDYPVTIEPGMDGKFCLEFASGDVGDSFNGRVGDLIDAMAPHVLDAFMVKITNESLSEDNSEEIFGGPNEEAILAYKRDHAIKEAMDLLRGAAPDAYTLLQGALTGSTAAAGAPKIVITVEGGVVQSVMSNTPVEVFSVDYDTDGTADDELVAIPQDGSDTESAICGISSADVDPKRVDEIAAVINEVVGGQEKLHKKLSQRG